MPEKVAETTVEISTPTKVEPKTFSTDGLLPQEVKMAEKHGLVKTIDESSKKEDKADGELKVEPNVKTPSIQEEEKGEKGKEVEAKPTFEEVQKNEDNLKKYNPNEQALYWKYKADKKKRQEAQKDAEEWRAKYELETLQGNVKIKKISEALGKGEVTIEALQAIIGTNSEDDVPLTKSEFKKLESAKEVKEHETKRELQHRAERISTAEEIGKTKYENFDELTTLAKQVVDSDKTDTYKGVLEASFSDIDLDEEQLVERVVTIARLHPDYGKKKSDSSKKEPAEEKKETDVDRAINNSKKKISSASVGSGGGKRNVSYDDLTVEDAAQLTTAQWMKLPDAVRKRLLM